MLDMLDMKPRDVLAYMNQSCRDDDSSPKLFDYCKGNVVDPFADNSFDEYWQEYSNPASDHDHKQRADSKWDIVGPFRNVTSPLQGALRFSSAYAVSGVM